MENSAKTKTFEQKLKDLFEEEYRKEHSKRTKKGIRKKREQK